ncbi:uncharacterized protein LOC130723053 [Lotus japonicus]|uniref:uncharacterized protein LOC130723053 n=1 Tax=Lotus japonicus TaxID=34305 RepID=UPI0025861E65|nr:uncharacterized protein LOC130723053 [Lotus japonicus]
MQVLLRRFLENKEKSVKDTWRRKLEDPPMSMADWFTMVSPSGGTRYEMLDQDDPGAWVVDPIGHRATYTGRIMEDRVDRFGRLTEGVMRRHIVSFNLPPGVHCGPGLGGPPPPSSSDDEDPSEEVPVGGFSTESSPSVAAVIEDLVPGPEPNRPVQERIRVDREGSVVYVDLVVLDADSDDDRASM